MLAVQLRAYRLFDRALAGFSGIWLITFSGLYLTQRLGTLQVGVGTATVWLSLIHLIYFFSLYPRQRERSISGASMIGAILVIANIALLVLTSGGLLSAYYALWLLLVLAVGIYRPSVILGLIGLTTTYFLGYLLAKQPTSSGLVQAMVALAATYITGGMGFWLWHSHHTRLRQSTDPQRLSDQLLQAEVKSELLLQQMGEGVLAVDRELRITTLNPAATELTGWTATDAMGLNYRSVLTLATEDGQPLPPEDDLLAAVIKQAQVTRRDDLFINTRSGKRRAVSITASPLGRGGGAMAVLRDVTAARQAERQRNEFISTASHEMRTPVAAVEGYIALALNPKLSQVDDSARKYLQKAQTSTQHLGKLFQDLLAITRIEEGKLPSHPEVVDLNQLIGQVLDELRFKAQKHQLKLLFNGGTGLSPLYYVWADPERLREVLANLIDNAIKFTPTGSVQVTLEGKGKEVIVGVKDSGLGIGAEDIPHLFQKFYRSEQPLTQRAGGTGLGLYISRAIVEMYQGRIWVESAPGRGSHFKFSLPRLSYEAAQQKGLPATATTAIGVPAANRVK